MQEDLKKDLEEKGLEIEVWDEEKMRVWDSDRIIIIAILNEFCETDRINNEVMDQIRQLQMDSGKEEKSEYGEFTIRQIMWDVYILYVLFDEDKFVDEEQIFMLQRDTKYSKKYFFQGNDVVNISADIFDLLHPENFIEEVEAEIQYDVSDEDNCKKICDSEHMGKEFVEKYRINSCQDILDYLDKINADEYGELVDENC